METTEKIVEAYVRYVQGWVGKAIRDLRPSADELLKNTFMLAAIARCNCRRGRDLTSCRFIADGAGG